MVASRETALDAAFMLHATTELCFLVTMTDRYFANAFVAIVMGTGIGMLLSVAGQKALNNHFKSTCKTVPAYSLIRVQSFIGDAYYCVKDEYLK